MKWRVNECSSLLAAMVKRQCCGWCCPVSSVSAPSPRLASRWFGLLLTDEHTGRCECINFQDTKKVCFPTQLSKNPLLASPTALNLLEPVLQGVYHPLCGCCLEQQFLWFKCSVMKSMSMLSFRSPPAGWMRMHKITVEGEKQIKNSVSFLTLL